MKLRLTLALALFVLPSAGSEAVGATAHHDWCGAFHTIGISSTIGDTLGVQNGWDRDEHGNVMNIREWAIDESVTAQATHAIAKCLAVFPVQLPTEWVMNKRVMDDRSQALGIDVYVGNDRDPLPQNSTTSAVDAYLLIHPAFAMYVCDMCERQNHCAHQGLGFEWTDSFWLQSAIECANYEIEVVDVKSGKSIAHAHSILAEDKAKRNQEPIRWVDRSEWPNEKNEFLPVQLGAIREDYQTLVSDSLLATLDQLELTEPRAPVPPPVSDAAPAR